MQIAIPAIKQQMLQAQNKNFNHPKGRKIKYSWIKSY